MATRISWNIQGKVLYIGVDTGIQQSTFKIPANAAKAAEAFRMIADLLDPQPVFDPRPSVVEQQEWDVPQRPQEGPQQVHQQPQTPFPPLVPEARFQSAYEFSQGRLADGTPIATHIPEDPAEAASLERLKAYAYERAMAGVADVKGRGEKAAEDLPQVEARPNDPVARRQGLDSKGLPQALPPSPTTLRGDQQIRERPRVSDPAFRFKDTH